MQKIRAVAAGAYGSHLQSISDEQPLAKSPAASTAAKNDQHLAAPQVVDNCGEGIA
jgi:hypothetical protein